MTALTQNGQEILVFAIGSMAALAWGRSVFLSTLRMPLARLLLHRGHVKAAMKLRGSAGGSSGCGACSSGSGCGS